MMAATTETIAEGEEDNIQTNYVQTKPYSFSSLQRVQKYYPKLNQNEIKNKLSSLDVYSMFRKKRSSKRVNPIFVRHRRHLFQVVFKNFYIKSKN